MLRMENNNMPSCIYGIICASRQIVESGMSMLCAYPEHLSPTPLIFFIIQFFFSSLCLSQFFFFNFSLVPVSVSLFLPTCRWDLETRNLTPLLSCLNSFFLKLAQFSGPQTTSQASQGGSVVTHLSDERKDPGPMLGSGVVIFDFAFTQILVGPRFCSSYQQLCLLAHSNTKLVD